MKTVFRPVLILVIAFAAVSFAMIAALVVLAASGNQIDSAVWIRCSLVLASSVLLVVFASRAARGARDAWVRLRIISPIVVAAIIVIVSIPGFLPDWVRLEQALCGLLVLPAAILVNLPRAKTSFSPEA
jgi:hypothetical protein